MTAAAAEGMSSLHPFWVVLIVLFTVGVVAVAVWNWVAACPCGKKRWAWPYAHDVDCWRFPPDID